MGPVIRPLALADALGCARLHAQAFALPWSAADFREQILRADRVMTGAWKGGALVGFAASRFVAGEADLLTIVVDAANRRGGLATKLLGYHLSALSQQRVTSVFLEVDAQNVAATALYRHFGFRPVGERKDYYTREAGRAEALVLRCDL